MLCDAFLCPYLQALCCCTMSMQWLSLPCSLCMHSQHVQILCAVETLMHHRKHASIYNILLRYRDAMAVFAMEAASIISERSLEISFASALSTVSASGVSVNAGQSCTFGVLYAECICKCGAKVAQDSVKMASLRIKLHCMQST